MAIDHYEEIAFGSSLVTVGVTDDNPPKYLLQTGASFTGDVEVDTDALETLTGAVTETAPTTDIASSGLNGRLQRIAQRITSLIALLPSSLGAKAAANSLAVTVATDDILVGRLGEVQASPTANTVLDRLKALLTGIVLATGTNIIGSTKDAGAHWTSVFGVSGARFTSANASGSAASVSDAPTSGQKLVVTDVIISVDTAMRVDLKEETSGTVLASIYLPANGVAQITPRSKLKLAVADKKLQVQTSASGNIAVTAFYFSEA